MKKKYNKDANKSLACRIKELKKHKENYERWWNEVWEEIMKNKKKC